MVEASEEAGSIHDKGQDGLVDATGQLSAKGVQEVIKTSKPTISDDEAALNFFLSDDNDVDVTFRLQVTRTKVWLEFRAIQEAELKSLQRRAATGKRMPGGGKEVDLPRLYRLILTECMTSPNLKQQDILLRFGRAEDALEAKLHPGEIENLAEKVMIKSGFSDDSVVEEEPQDEVELAKN